jgi:hypothetical protein
MSSIQPGFWRCRQCQRIEPNVHVFCGQCATERYDYVLVGSGDQKEVKFSNQYKCAIVAFIKGCLSNNVDLNGVKDYDLIGVQTLLKQLEETGFFEFSKTKDALLTGDEVGDEIFTDLGLWFGVSVVIIHENPAFTRRVGCANKQKSFKIEWSCLGNIGHWIYKA